MRRRQHHIRSNEGSPAEEVGAAVGERHCVGVAGGGGGGSANDAGSLQGGGEEVGGRCEGWEGH